MRCKPVRRWEAALPGGPAQVRNSPPKNFCQFHPAQGCTKSADATTERSVLAKNANPAAANVKNPTAALHAGREQKMLRAKASDATVDSLTTERMLRRGSSSNARPGKPPSSGSPFARAQLQLPLDAGAATRHALPAVNRITGQTGEPGTNRNCPRATCGSSASAICGAAYRSCEADSNQCSYILCMARAASS